MDSYGLYVITVLECFIAGAGNCTVPKIYIAETMPERTYSILMGLHWIIFYIFSVSLSYSFYGCIKDLMVKHDMVKFLADLNSLWTIHMVIYAAAAGLVSGDIMIDDSICLDMDEGNKGEKSR